MTLLSFFSFIVTFSIKKINKSNFGVIYMSHFHKINVTPIIEFGQLVWSKLPPTNLLIDIYTHTHLITINTKFGINNNNLASSSVQHTVTTRSKNILIFIKISCHFLKN